jgi:hypothetical protein
MKSLLLLFFRKEGLAVSCFCARRVKKLLLFTIRKSFIAKDMALVFILRAWQFMVAEGGLVSGTGWPQGVAAGRGDGVCPLISVALWGGAC